ncbi:MAG: hypothetical protein H7Y01_15370, partial [Ferruginibacter sp.]|nr:hypothetical protein [Chitinophagaceae bacterium]
GIITAAELCLYLENTIFLQLHDAGIRREKRQVPMLFPLEKHNKGQFVFLNPGMQDASRIRLKHKTGHNPYKGLSAYGAGDNSLFYGRRRVIEDGWSVDNTFYPSLKKVILSHKVIVVTGPSGIGKSSLVRAGVLPLCRELGCEKWHEIRPGKNPYSTNEFFFAERRKDLQPSIILVDQYEELVTECNNEKERIDFEEALETLQSNHIIILTIRSDFEAHFKDTFIAPAAWRKSYYRFVVPPFSRQELKEIVTQPATQEVLEFRPFVEKDEKRTGEDFINRIVDETHQQPGSLPLLSLALSELYEKRDGVNLLEKVYNEFSGISNIIERKATEAYNLYQDKPGMQQLFKFLIYRMISLDGGEIAKRKIFTKYQAEDNNAESLNDLSFADPNVTVAIQEIKTHLEKERLLNSGTDEKGNEYTEPAHDALLRSWPMLLKWLNDDSAHTGRTEKNNLLLHEAVKDIAVEYRKEKDLKKKNKYLWQTDPRLGLVRRPEIKERLNRIEYEFIEDSYKAKVNSKRRNIVIVSAAFLIIGTIAAIALVQAKIARAEAKRNQALYLASESEKYLPSDAIRLLEYAYDLAPGETSVMQKMQALTSYATDINLFTLANMEHPKEIMGADYNESTQTLISVCHQDSVVRLWNLKGVLLGILTPPTHSIVTEAFFLDNRNNNIIILSRAGRNSYISVFTSVGKLVKQHLIYGEVSNLSHSFSGAMLFGKIFAPNIDSRNGLTLFSTEIEDGLQPLTLRLLNGNAFYPYINSDSFMIKDGASIRVYAPGLYLPVKTFSIDPEFTKIIMSKFGHSMLLTNEMESAVQILYTGDSAEILQYRSDIKKMILSNAGEVNIWYQDSMLHYSGETNNIYTTKSEGETEYDYYLAEADKDYFHIDVNKEDELGKILSDEDITTTIRYNIQYKKIKYNGVFFASFDSLGSKKLSYDNNIIRYWDFNSKEFDSRNSAATETRLVKYVDEGKKIYIFSNMDEDADTVICTLLDQQFNHIDELHLAGNSSVIEDYPYIFEIGKDTCSVFEFRKNRFEKVSQTFIGRRLDYCKLSLDKKSIFGISNNNKIIRVTLPQGTLDSFPPVNTAINEYYEIAGREDQLFIIDSSLNC